MALPARKTAKDVGFSWWSRTFRKLTKTKIVEAQFKMDLLGNVIEY